MPVRFDHRAALVALAALLGSLTAAQAAELDAKAVQIKTPDQFKWRDPSMRAPNNAVLLAVSPDQSVIEVVYGAAVRGRGAESAAPLGVAAASSAFEQGHLIDGLVSAIRVLSSGISPA